MKKVSIVTPLFNEEENVKELYKQISDLMAKEKNYQFEIIAIEHGSSDSTFKILKSIHKKDPRLKIIQLSKNFGNVDAAISAGLNFSSGDAAVILMGDLQEPPALISNFLRKWEQGYEIVYGIVKKRADFSKIRYFNSLMFYKVLRLLTGNILPENTSDFRLVDKKVYQAVNAMPEKNKFLKGLTIWSGFSQIGVDYSRHPRFAGVSKADSLTVLKVAANAIFSFSYIPLRVVTFMGIFLAFISFAITVFEVAGVIIYGRQVPGLLTVIVLVSFLFGMLFIILGVIGEYLARIYDEVKQRPIFIVKEKIGF